MRNSTLSRLALLGLASVSSVAFAASTMNGQVRFDARFTLNQDKADGSSVQDSLEKSDNLFISRARLDFAGDVAKDWTYNVRLEYSELENDQIGLDPQDIAATSNYAPFSVNGSALSSIDAVISRAYVCWSGVEGINVKMGRIGTPEVTSDRLYYRPYIGSTPNDRAVGSVTNYSGDHAGFAVDGIAGPIGYSFGVWKQTDLRKLELTAAEVDAVYVTGTLAAAGDSLEIADFSDRAGSLGADAFDSKSLRVGFGGRLSFAQDMKSGTSFGVGIGYNQAPLNMAVMGIAVAQLPTAVAATGANAGAYAYGAGTYKDLSNLGIDASAVFKSFQLNLGYQYQEMKKDTAMANAAENLANGSGAATVTAASYNMFDQKGSASAFWVELGYLVMGDSYKFCSKNAVVSGVKLREKQAGFEITARYGTENRKNMLALLSPVGLSDFNTDANGTLALQRAYADVVAVNGYPADKALVITMDNTDATVGPTVTLGRLASASATAADDFFETKMTGFAVSLNYYMAENAVLKLEYDSRHNEFKRTGIETAWKDSAFAKNVGTLRLRADYSF